MNRTTIIAAVLIAFGVLSVWKPSLKGPDDIPDINAPSASLQVMVKLITELLNGHSEQARILAEFYFESSKTIRRDGQNEKIIKTKHTLKLFLERAATLRFAGTFQEIHGLADVIHGEDGALAKIVGLEAGLLDHEKSADALHAVAWACQEAK